MRIMITARHTRVTDALRRRARTLVERIASHAHRPQRAEVIFDEGHNCRIVELQLYVPRGRIAVATAEADRFTAALDLAVGKLRHQLSAKVKKPAAKWRTARKRSPT
jgi:ribosomal subunit interface protein